MKVKKIAAVLSAAAMIASLVPMSVAAENTVPEGYLYYEDFEGEYNTAYDSPTPSEASGGKRWSSSLAGDASNHYMKYTFIGENAEFTGNNGEAYNVNVTGNDRNNPNYPLDRDTWYEIGYKFDMNDCKPRFNSFMQIKLGSVQAHTTMQGWKTGTSNGILSLENGTDSSGTPVTLNINQDDVDGFISTKILFNLHGSTQTDTNFNQNGEAVYYVSYKTKSGEQKLECLNYRFPSASNTNNYARSSRFFEGIIMSEGWNGTPADGTSFYIDDVYIKQSYTYTVSFNTGYDDVSVPDATAVGGVLTAVPQPEKAGALFDGWFEDAEYIKPFDNFNIKSDITVYAKWRTVYTITFNSNGGSVVEPVLTAEDSITLPQKPTKTGETFVGWFKDENLTEPFDGTGITGDMTVYAKWFSAVYYEDFESGYNADYAPPAATGGAAQRWAGSIEGDDANSYMKYTFNSSVEQAAGNMQIMKMDITGKDRRNPDYLLDRNKWYELGYKFNMNDCRIRLGGFMQVSLGSIQANTIMPAWNTNAYTVNILKLDGIDDSGNSKTLTVNSDEVDGFVTTKIQFNMHGYTQTAENCDKNGEAIYYVSYTKKNGEAVNDSVTVRFPTAQKNNYVPERFSHAFSGFISAEGWKQSTESGSSFFIDDIYIKLSDIYTVHFVTGFDDVIVPDATVQGGVLSSVPIPKKEGAEFIGWYTDPEFTTEFDYTNINSDMTVYAKWNVVCTVSFNSNGGSETEPIATMNGVIVLPPAPQKVPYRFDGWFRDEALTIPFDGTGITDNITVYAKWSDIIFSESFDADTYNTAFDSPVAANGAEQRWTNRISANAGGGSMEYIFHDVAEEVGNNTHAFSAEVMGDRLNPNYPLDRNTWYELGYRFDMNNCTARFGSFMQVVLGSTNAESTMLSWNTGVSGSNKLYLSDPGREAADIVINRDDVDGYITARILFNLHGDTQTEENWQTNGEARCYISYNTTDGEHINLYREFSFPSSSNNASEGRSARFLKGFYASEGYNSVSADGSSFFIDDIYIKLQGNAYSVTFNTNGGTHVNKAEADLFGNITMPENPTKPGYSFAGWFLDEALTQPFDGTGVTSGDITVYARWQQTPNVVSVTPADGSVNVNIRPEILIAFDSEMKNETLTKNNIRVLKALEDLQTPYELIISNDESRNTLVKIVFSGNLDFSNTYTVKVLPGAANTAGGMDSEFTAAFTTAKMSLDVTNVTVKDESGNTVVNLNDAEGKRINISFKIHNNTADAVSYTPILSIMNNGALKEAAIGEANSESTEINVPSGSDGGELGLMIFDGINGLKPLAEKTEVIK